MRNERIESAVNYAWYFIGTPYLWGGENPIEGYDCSGFVQEVLRSVGLDPTGDQTAQALWEYFKKEGDAAPKPRAGALAFYGSRYRISHVAFCINDHQIIEAGGGGKKTRSKEDAANHNAFIRLRPIDHRKDLIEIRMPCY